MGLLDNWPDNWCWMLTAISSKHWPKWSFDQRNKFPPIWAHKAEDQQCVHRRIVDQREHNGLGKLPGLQVEHRHGHLAGAFGGILRSWNQHQQREENEVDGHEHQ